MENTMNWEDVFKQQLIDLLPRLRRFARSLTKDEDKADDLVQTACERALIKFFQFRPGTRMHSWLYRIIYTSWIDKLRRGKARSDFLRVFAAETKPINPEAQNSGSIAAAIDIQDALGLLHEEHRVALFLVCVEGYSYAEIAEILNVPMGTVASRVARGRTLLNKVLSAEQSEGLSYIKSKKERYR